MAVDLPVTGVNRLLGIELSSGEIQGILESLEFEVEGVDDGALRATVPDHRMDISAGVVGQADLIEEVARIYGYDRIPHTQFDDVMPPQRDNVPLLQEEQARDLLVEALRRAEGVRRVAASLLGVDERNLSYYLKKHDLMDYVP